MKILHMADLHLDSKMETNFSAKQARERKNELLVTFKKSIEFAFNENVAAVLIAGDIFDSRNISKTTISIVRDIIASHEEILFFCLKGNHDCNDILEQISFGLKNVILFNEKWASYEIDDTKVVVTGIENKKAGDLSKLELDSSDINIVMLHGQIKDGGVEEKSIDIPISILKNKNIDYLALGHIHSYSEGVIDNRGIYVYPGCMESRGFDEEGLHGIVLIDINERTGEIKHTLHKIENRSCIVVEIDVSDCFTSYDAEKAASILDNFDEKDIIEAVLVGDVDAESNIDINYLEKVFENRFYLIKWIDKTTIKIDPDLYSNEKSLRGEFVRLVRSSKELTDEEKNAVIYMGIKALRGEDVSYDNHQN